MPEKPLLEISGLKKYYPIEAGITKRQVGLVKAVDDITLSIRKNEVLGVVGESGCGKTTLVRSMLRLIEPTGGEIFYKGEDFRKLDKKQLKGKRKDVQIVFQDPFGSLHPKMRIRTILEEPLIINHYGDKEARMARVKELMRLVDLKEEQLDRYPHEFSGGQRQRICIARALALNPEFIVCDEPVSALDVSIQAQIINLLKNLQEKYNLTYLFISHDLSVVEYISDTVGVMYLGNLVEYGATEDIFRNPLHPYTKALFSAIPVPDPTVKMDRIVLEGSIPSPANPPAGCKFHTRCANCMEKCKTEVPQQREIEPGHYVVCHLYDEA